MSYFIPNFLKYAPEYFDEFFAVAAETKNFVAAKSVADIDTLREPLLFLTRSIVLIVLIFAFLAGLTDIARLFVLTAVPVFLLVLLWTVIVQAIWRWLGGRMSARHYFSIFAYFSGVTVVLAPFVGLFILDVFQRVLAASPNVYRNAWEALTAQQPISSYDLVLAAIPLALVLLVMALFSWWLSPAREAFHRMHGLSRARSFLAQVFFSVAWPSASVAVLLVYNRLVHIAAGI